VKRIAVLVRERQGEALRMSVGLTLADDRVEVYVLDRPVAHTRENLSLLQTLRELDVPLCTNAAASGGMAHCPVDEIAGRILACDIILPY
jgi:hypothetical protein